MIQGRNNLRSARDIEAYQRCFIHGSTPFVQSSYCLDHRISLSAAPNQVSALFRPVVHYIPACSQIRVRLRSLLKIVRQAGDLEKFTRFMAITTVNSRLIWKIESLCVLRYTGLQCTLYRVTSKIIRAAVMHLGKEAPCFLKSKSGQFLQVSTIHPVYLLILPSLTPGSYTRLQPYPRESSRPH